MKPANSTIPILVLALCSLAIAQDTGAQPPQPQDVTAAIQSAQQPDSTTLERIKYEPPVYPLEAREKGIQGEVRLKLEVSETGAVEKVDVVSGDPILAQAAVPAATKWRFKPFIRNGKAVRVRTEMPVDFAFEGNVKDINPPAAASNPPSPPPSSPSGTPNAVKLSQRLVAGFLIHKVTPVYPVEAKRKRIVGTVLLHAVISKTGQIESLKPISGPPELIPPAIGAVEQWKYRPYFVNGEAVNIDTTITIKFAMGP